jgi:hypothetical protein
VLLVIIPLPVIGFSILPIKHPLTLTLAVLELALVYSTILPGELALSLPYVVFPLAVVNATVRVLAFSKSLNVVLDELAFVGGVVFPTEHALPVLVATLIASVVERAGCPGLAASSLGLVVNPLAPVLGPIGGEEGTRPISFVICPISFVHASIANY